MSIGLVMNNLNPVTDFLFLQTISFLVKLLFL